MNHADAKVLNARLEVTEVRKAKIDDEQGANEEAAGQGHVQRLGLIHRVEAKPAGKILLLDMPYAPMDLLERAQKHQEHGKYQKDDGELKRG